jgi:hypothetical protein
MIAIFRTLSANIKYNERIIRGHSHFGTFWYSLLVERKEVSMNDSHMLVVTGTTVVSEKRTAESVRMGRLWKRPLALWRNSQITGEHHPKRHRHDGNQALRKPKAPPSKKRRGE